MTSTQAIHRTPRSERTSSFPGILKGRGGPGSGLILTLALVLAAGASCHRWRLLMIDLPALGDPQRIRSLKATVREIRDGGVAQEGFSVENEMRPTNAAFFERTSIGVYLPEGVWVFSLEIDALDSDGCRILSGSGIFDVDQSKLTIALMIPTREACVVAMMPDAGDVGDAGTHPDVADADSGSPDGGDAGPDDHADGGTDTGTAVACFDPNADAGTAVPVTGIPLNLAECDPYCQDMTTNCPGTFADLNGCRTICTAAGWHLPPDIDASATGDTVLSCLTKRARTASSASDCRQAGPVAELYCGTDSCGDYCELRSSLCGDDHNQGEQCRADCDAALQANPTLFACVFQNLVQMVPGDTRYCSWSSLSLACGACWAR